MDQGSANYPAVFVVDNHRAYPPMPPTLKRPPRSGKLTQNVLFFLVSVALFGMAMEACLIYRLYHRDQVRTNALSLLYSSPNFVFVIFL